MRLGIVGSRTFPDQLVRDYVDRLEEHTVVITGGWSAYAGRLEATPGVDRIAYRRAEERGLVTVLCVGSKTKHGRLAGLQRNPTIATLSEHVVAFWDLKSRGTMDTLRWCIQLQRPVTVINPDGHGVDDWARHVQDR